MLSRLKDRKRQELWRNYLLNFSIVTIFVGFFFLGIHIYQDYGLSIDEATVWRYGNIVLNYVFQGDQALMRSGDKMYGPIFAMVGELLVRIVQPQSSRESVLLWHLLAFLLFYASVVAFYFISLRHFRNRLLALIGCIFLVASPRIFGAAFMDPKDVPFLSLNIIAFLTLILFLQKRSYASAAIHGLACAAAIDMRVTGIFIPILTAAIFILDGLLEHRWSFWKINLPKLLVFVAVCSLGIYAMWPTLWQHPFRSFLFAYHQMSNFPWPGNQIYNGGWVKANDLPWHYIFVWIGISTPLSYLVLAGIGLMAFFRSLLRGIGTRNERLEEILFLSWLVIPVLAVIVLHSTLYFGWRHLYFVYPALLLFSIKGLQTIIDLLKKSKRRMQCFLGFIVLLLTVNVISVVSFMIRNHPLEYVYFNEAIGGIQGASGRYELDYWVLANTDALKIIGKDELSHSVVKIHAGTWRQEWTIFPSDWKINIAESGSALSDYFVDDRPWGGGPRNSPYQSIGAVMVDDTVISRIYRAVLSTSATRIRDAESGSTLLKR